MKAVLVDPDSPARLLRLLADGRLKTLVTHTEHWTEVGAVAQALMNRSYTGKAILNIS